VACSTGSVAENSRAPAAAHPPARGQHAQPMPGRPQGFPQNRAFQRPIVQNPAMQPHPGTLQRPVGPQQPGSFPQRGSFQPSSSPPQRGGTQPQGFSPRAGFQQQPGFQQRGGAQRPSFQPHQG